MSPATRRDTNFLAFLRACVREARRNRGSKIQLRIIESPILKRSYSTIYSVVWQARPEPPTQLFSEEHLSALAIVAYRHQQPQLLPLLPLPYRYHATAQKCLQ